MSYVKRTRNNTHSAGKSEGVALDDDAKNNYLGEVQQTDREGRPCTRVLVSLVCLLRFFFLSLCPSRLFSAPLGETRGAAVIIAMFIMQMNLISVLGWPLVGGMVTVSS